MSTDTAVSAGPRTSTVGAASLPTGRRGFDALGVGLVATALGVIALGLRDMLVPAKFSTDGEVIARIAAGARTGLGDKSFANVASVYAWLGMAERPVAAALFGFGLAAVAYALAARRSGTRDLLPSTAFVLGFGIVASAIYLGIYSKEVIPLLLVIGILAARPGWVWEAAIVAGLLGYAAVFRTYWVLVAVLYVALRVAIARRWSARSLVVLALGYLGALAVLMPALQHVALDEFRTTVNEARVGSSAAMTAITPYLDVLGPMGAWVNTVLALVFIVLPLPLLAMGSPYYLVAGGALTVVWIVAFRSGISILRAHRSGAVVPATVQRAMALVLAFLVVQAVFEPDYGSVLKHQMAVLPLVFFLSAWQGHRLQEASV